MTFFHKCKHQNAADADAAHHTLESIDKTQLVDETMAEALYRLTRDYNVANGSLQVDDHILKGIESIANNLNIQGIGGRWAGAN
jgi:hypothetical protein